MHSRMRPACPVLFRVLGPQAEKDRLQRQASRWAERTIDAQRASAPVPKWVLHSLVARARPPPPEL